MKAFFDRKRRDDGFTLLEVLVAVALASIVIIALYGSFFSVLTGRSDIDRALEQTREVSRFLETFSREIQSSFFKGGNLKTGFAGTEESKNGRSTSRLSITTFTYPLVKSGQPAGDLLAVSYYVDDMDGKAVLYKETWNPYGVEKTGVFKADVIEDIVGFEILYYNGNDWAKAWDARLDNALPQAVKVTLSIKDRGEVKEFSAIARTMIR